MRVRILSKNSTPQSRPGFEPETLDPENIVLTIRPPRHFTGVISFLVLTRDTGETNTEQTLKEKKKRKVIP